MADILIQGMEMPQDGRITIQIGADGTVYLVEKCTIMAEKYEKSSHAVPLPEGHGNLIDADALIRDKSGEANLWCGYEYQDHSVVFEEDIKTAPTIVPAEGDCENDI